uniref:Uncharacterized protein n=1 Tax=Ditylenchus dipsaci TaxID=166011 RepID=A0A915CQA6_9BILA
MWSKGLVFLFLYLICFDHITAGTFKPVNGLMARHHSKAIFREKLIKQCVKFEVTFQQKIATFFEPNERQLNRLNISREELFEFVSSEQERIDTNIANKCEHTKKTMISNERKPRFEPLTISIIIFFGIIIIGGLIAVYKRATDNTALISEQSQVINHLIEESKTSTRLFENFMKDSFDTNSNLLFAKNTKFFKKQPEVMQELSSFFANKEVVSELTTIEKVTCDGPNITVVACFHEVEDDSIVDVGKLLTPRVGIFVFSRYLTGALKEGRGFKVFLCCREL